MKLRRFTICTGPVVVPAEEGVEIISMPLQHTVEGHTIKYVCQLDLIFFHVLRDDQVVFATHANSILWFTAHDQPPKLAAVDGPIEHD